jgi:hypothetical protein
MPSLSAYSQTLPHIYLTTYSSHILTPIPLPVLFLNSHLFLFSSLIKGLSSGNWLYRVSGKESEPPRNSFPHSSRVMQTGHQTHKNLVQSASAVILYPTIGTLMHTVAEWTYTLTYTSVNLEAFLVLFCGSCGYGSC